jgi:hypothetical protein
MNAIKKNAALALLAALLLAGASGCITEDRTVEFVITEDTCAPFEVDEQGVSFVLPAYVFLSDELNGALEDNDVARDDIVTARIVSLAYEVTSFSQGHDWTITGSITVERQDISDGPDTLLSYTDQSVEDALGKRIPASLNADGVGVVNRAFDDFIAGGNPVIVFKVRNGGVSPAPSPSDHLVFTWQPCLVTHIVVKKDMEVPDPF